MQYPLFLLSHPVGNLFFHCSVVFQQTLIQSGRKRNLVDKVHHFAPFYSKLRDCRGRYFDWIMQKIVGYSPLMHLPDGRGEMLTVTVEVLDKLKRVSELNEDPLSER